MNTAIIQDMQIVGADSRHNGSKSDGEVDSTSSFGGDRSQHSGSSPHNDSNSASSQTGSHATGTSGGQTSAHGDNPFQNEGGALSGARCCFLMTLIVCACALATVVHLVTTNSQTDDFETQFYATANSVFIGSNDNVVRVFESLETLALTGTTFIKQQNTDQDNKPAGFFTMPNAEHHMGSAREDSKAFLLGYAPVVQGTDQFDMWKNYSANHIDWVDEAFQVNPNGDVFVPHYQNHSIYQDIWFDHNIWYIQEYNKNDELLPISEETALTCPTRGLHPFDHDPTNYNVHVVEDPAADALYAPIWMTSPPPNPNMPSNINFNLRKDPLFEIARTTMQDTRSSTFYDICDATSKWFEPPVTGDADDLFFFVMTPAFDSHEHADANIVGYFFVVVPWQVLFDGILIDTLDPVYVVVEDECRTKAFTYLLQGKNATLLDGGKDVHESNSVYNGMAQTDQLAAFSYPPTDDQATTATCNAAKYMVTVYPTMEFEITYANNEPLYYTLAVLAIFLFTACAFFAFDCLVQRRQAILVATATKQNALVSSLFPKNIQKKLLEEMETEAAIKNKTGKAGLRTFLNEESMAYEEAPLSGGDNVKSNKPIADLFPETTIMFADIAGFTAWSSTREPTAVFTLLEAIYAEFDSIAKRRRVFKVEVVGDCYVAVAGLPDPRPDHALVMAKFANDCVNRMFRMVRKLEVELGPDTAELSLRAGLHSGPVVAGVLRGEKSRFQLFGDTMNTASRMESNGVPGRIQISQDTADLLKELGKEHWLQARETKISAKGKGELQTYFLNVDGSANKSSGSSVGTLTSSGELSADEMMLPDAQELMERRNRVAEWTVEVLAQQLKVVLDCRKQRKEKPCPEEEIEALEQETLSQRHGSKTVIDEVAEYIVLPEYKYNPSDDLEDELDPEVMDELRSYVQTIASLYNENPFHCFDHANHVVMSVNKLLSRINAPDLDECTATEIHDHTYGITSDPLTWFACIFSALIHDVDHSGVPNAQLVKEEAPVASLYKGKSVAEQNSFDLAWDLLMEPSYKNLRHTIYSTVAEFKRFRQLVVNGVMATDIVDKDLKTLRNNRWDTAFDDSQTGAHAKLLKATIVIEHLIQASDVAHTMQHWHIYRRWNEKFFRECYQAYLDGRSESNPAKTWYKGEIGFFDFYIIPLAKKLKDCGVFGVSSDEYLSYAMQNRKEWEERGEDMVRDMVRNARRLDLALAKKERTGEL